MSDVEKDYAVMVICAADADQIWHIATNSGAIEGANPALPGEGAIEALKIGYIHDGNFDVLGQLRCNDVYISRSDSANTYGLVLVAKQPVGPMAPGDMLRGDPRNDGQARVA